MSKPRTRINLMPKPKGPPIDDDTEPSLRLCGCGQHWIDPNGDTYRQHSEWEELQKEQDDSE